MWHDGRVLGVDAGPGGVQSRSMGVPFSGLVARLRGRDMHRSAVVEGLSWDETPLGKREQQRLYQASQYVERPVALGPYREALATMLRELAVGGKSCARVQPKIEALRREVMHLAHANAWAKRLQHFPGEEQQAYDLFNLAAEVRDAALFENPQREIFAHALDILEQHLGDMHSSLAWRRLVSHRLAVEAVSERTCAGCGHREIEFLESGFSGRAHASCEQCGDVLSLSCALEAENEILRALRSRSDDERDTILAAVGRRLPSCPCGGRFVATADQCAQCGGKDFRRRAHSRYEFAQRHRMHQMEELLSRLRSG